jgi:Transcriptional regulators
MTGMEAGHRGRTVADGGPPWRPARFASFVVEELAEAIVSGALAEGDVLPPSRARRAVRVQSYGRPRRAEDARGARARPRRAGTRHHGQPRSAWNLLDPVVLRIALAHDHDMSLLDDLIAVRVVLEREMAKAAAGRLTADEIADLAENLERLNESYDDYERFRSFDLAFHAIVMKASGNEVGLTIVRAIHRHGGITPLLAAGASREALEQTAREHRDIYDAWLRGTGRSPATGSPSTSNRPGRRGS